MQSTAKTFDSGTVVLGFFNDSTHVHEALTELRGSGFSPETITQTADQNDTTQEKNGWMDSLANFFNGSSESGMTNGSDSNHRRLMSMGLDENSATELEHRLDAGGVLVSVKGGNKGTEALDILKRHGASPAQVNANDVSSASRVVGKTPAVTADTQHIQLLKEVLQVNKERVQRGEVTLRKEVITEIKTIEVPVTREELVIERTPSTTDKTASGQIGEGEILRVPLSEERVVVEKRSVVAEDISVGKREIQDTQEVSEKVRREELRTENLVTEVSEQSKRNLPTNP